MLLENTVAYANRDGCMRKSTSKYTRFMKKVPRFPSIEFFFRTKTRFHTSKNVRFSSSFFFEFLRHTTFLRIYAYMVGRTHSWLVERIVCWLDFMKAMDIWSVWTLWLVWTYWTVWSLWSLWTQARRTTYELPLCETMYTSIRTPSACVSM